MADALPESALAELDDPFAQLTGPLASTTRLDFEVIDSARLTPHMQRLRLTAPQLDGFGYLPGQDVMLLVAAEGNRPVRRRYTIRRLDQAARLLTLDIVLHGVLTKVRDLGLTLNSVHRLDQSGIRGGDRWPFGLAWCVQEA